jgi:hypothetical protein
MSVILIGKPIGQKFLYDFDEGYLPHLTIILRHVDRGALPLVFAVLFQVAYNLQALLARRVIVGQFV